MVDYHSQLVTLLNHSIVASQVEFYNRLGTAPIQQKDCQDWRGIGISTANDLHDNER